jgi:hypothetical protein
VFLTTDLAVCHINIGDELKKSDHIRPTQLGGILDEEVGSWFMWTQILPTLI